MAKDTITITDATLRGMDCGCIIERDGRQVGHWPVSLDEAIDRIADEYPDAGIVVHNDETEE